MLAQCWQSEERVGRGDSSLLLVQALVELLEGAAAHEWEAERAICRTHSARPREWMRTPCLELGRQCRHGQHAWSLAGHAVRAVSPRAHSRYAARVTWQFCSASAIICLRMCSRSRCRSVIGPLRRPSRASVLSSATEAEDMGISCGVCPLCSIGVQPAVGIHPLY